MKERVWGESCGESLGRETGQRDGIPLRTTGGGCRKGCGLHRGGV